ncbi:MAG: 50S ribosomal protein L9, partial [Planctomycetota bacterium]
MSRISRKKKKVADHDVKLLLNETIRHLGKVGDVVKVKPGYARNYLIPKGLAIAPTAKNLERIEEKRKEYEKFEAALREDQAALLAKLEGKEVKLVRRANERGGLYGSVGASDIAHALGEMELSSHNNATITADEINLHGKIDHIGRAEADVRFTDDLMREIIVVVEPDDESRESIEEYEAEIKEREAAFAAQEAAEKE